jgi:hypothetical protein
MAIFVWTFSGVADAILLSLLALVLLAVGFYFLWQLMMEKLFK